MNDDTPPSANKAGAAFRTIGELSRDTGLPQHILRYWETRFPQLKPLQRAGNRRYYRPEDVALVRRIDQYLNREGYTVRGVQQLLAGEKTAPPAIVTSRHAFASTMNTPPGPATMKSTCARRLFGHRRSASTTYPRLSSTSSV